MTADDFARATDSFERRHLLEWTDTPSGVASDSTHKGVELHVDISLRNSMFYGLHRMPGAANWNRMPWSSRSFAEAKSRAETWAMLEWQPIVPPKQEQPK